MRGLSSQKILVGAVVVAGLLVAGYLGFSSRWGAGEGLPEGVSDLKIEDIPFDGKQAKQMGFVNFSYPKEKLREETVKLAKKLMEKSPAAMRYTKEAIRAVRFMNEPQAADYLNAKSDALKYNDKENSRGEGMKQFLDEKTYRPGLGHFKRKKVAAK